MSEPSGSDDSLVTAAMRRVRDTYGYGVNQSRNYQSVEAVERRSRETAPGLRTGASEQRKWAGRRQVDPRARDPQPPGATEGTTSSHWRGATLEGQSTGDGGLWHQGRVPGVLAISDYPAGEGG
jgi:hypothetical protein